MQPLLLQRLQPLQQPLPRRQDEDEGEEDEGEHEGAGFEDVMQFGDMAAGAIQGEGPVQSGHGPCETFCILVSKTRKEYMSA